jgi:hypothetical protein
MEFRIWVEVCLAGRVLHKQLVAQVEREATGIGPEEIGLTLEEGKTVLSQVQAGVIHRRFRLCKPLTGNAFSADANSASRIAGGAA